MLIRLSRFLKLAVRIDSKVWQHRPIVAEKAVPSSRWHWGDGIARKEAGQSWRKDQTASGDGRSKRSMTQIRSLGDAHGLASLQGREVKKPRNQDWLGEAPSEPEACASA